MENNTVKHTRNQELALMRDRHLVVTANAGSGKTSVLVSKFIDLLENSARSKSAVFRSIVAITFTRQAAADMKAKIVKKLSERLLDNNLNSSQLKLFKRLRESVSSARISTIHSFCNSLLREYPIEAGLSPVFRELDEFEQSNLANYAVDSVLEEYSEKMLNAESENKLSGELEIYSKLIDSVGISELRQYILQLIQEPVSLENYITFYDRDTNEIVEEYEKVVTDVFQETIISYVECYPTIKFLLNLIVEDELKLDEFYDVFERRTWADNIDSLIANIEEFRKLEIKNPFSNRKKNFINYVNGLVKNEKSNSLLKIYSETCSNLIEIILGTNKQREYTPEFIEQAKLLINLAAEAADRYNAEKDDLAAYSFDDLLMRSRTLLQNEEVRDKIVENIDYLLVDEFQDTNKIQYDIVEKLVPSLKNPNAKNSPKVFIVGDEKQSIYRFRGADVAVFGEASKDIVESNVATNNHQKSQFPQLVEISSEKVELSKEEANGDVSKGKLVLADTFRLLPGIAMFVNYTCNRIFKSLSGGDVKYEPFICGRALTSELNDGDTINTNNGSVRFLITIKEEIYKNNQTEINTEESIDEQENVNADSSEKFIYTPAKEEEQVVNYIKQIVAGKTDITIKRGDIDTTPEYRDIAILCRKKTSFQKLIPLLISNNIPYSISSGSGFYSTQEVLDFISLLKILINQNDDISCAGVLKSPLFNLTDAELVAISKSEGKSFYEKFQSFTPDNSQMSDLILRAKELMKGLVKASSRLSISELIILIIELTDYYGSIERFEAKEQIKANINQLMQNALEYESKGYKSLYDFIQRVEKLSESSKESEATFITGENLINIMTTHGAKGLEFPIVILFDTNSQNQTDKGLIKSKDLGVSFKFKISKTINNTTSLLVEQDTIPKILIKGLNDKKNKAEEARLLYVAMTRAKDHLIISSTMKAKKKDGFSISSNTFADFIFKTAFDFEELLNNKALIINDKLKFTSSNSTAKELNLYQNLQVLGYEKILDSDFNSGINAQDSEKEEYNFMLGTEIEPKGKFDIVSATKLSKYASDRDDFYANYVLGLPKIGEKSYSSLAIENILLNQSSPDSMNDSDSGAEAGTTIHKVLENINDWINDAIEGNYGNLNNHIEKALYNNFEQNNTKLYERVQNECIAISKSKLLIENAEHLQYSEFEKMLYMPLDSSMLIGTIDLLIKSKDERIIEVWDWKSNVVDSKEHFDSLVEHYLPQLKFYLLFISKIYTNRDKYVARLLFTRLSLLSEDWYYTLEIDKNELDIFEKGLSAKIAEVNEY